MESFRSSLILVAHKEEQLKEALVQVIGYRGWKMCGAEEMSVSD